MIPPTRTVLFLVMLFLSPVILIAQPEVKLDLQGERLTITNTTNQRMVFPKFKRKQAILILVVFENGVLIPDKFWEIPKSAFSLGYTFILDPNRVAPLSLGFQDIPGRFDLARNGTYFVICLLKKGKKGNNGVSGFFHSNLVSLNIENKVIKNSKEVHNDDLPAPVQKAITNEISKIENEEGAASTLQFPFKN